MLDQYSEKRICDNLEKLRELGIGLLLSNPDRFPATVQSVAARLGKESINDAGQSAVRHTNRVFASRITNFASLVAYAFYFRDNLSGFTSTFILRRNLHVIH